MCKLPAVCVAFAVQVALRPVTKSVPNHCCWQHRRCISPVNTRVTRIGGVELRAGKLSDDDGVSRVEQVSLWTDEYVCMREQIKRTGLCLIVSGSRFQLKRTRSFASNKSPPMQSRVPSTLRAGIRPSPFLRCLPAEMSSALWDTPDD